MPQSVTLITGARVYTADPSFPWAETVAVRGNTIAFVGSEADARAELGAGVEELRFNGGLVTPGLNDSHVHFAWGGEALTLLNLEGVYTVEELRDRLQRYARENPNKEWLIGYGLPYEPFFNLGRPEREVLDEMVADRPVMVRAFDFHGAWCNTEALRRAGIERGANIPLPNEVVVDPATGLATGMLKEREAYNLILDQMAPASETELEDYICYAVHHVNRLGITSVQNMNGDPTLTARFQRLLERGDLTVRQHHLMSVREHTPREFLDESAELMRRYADPWNHVNGIKLFIDGVVESKTAWMLEPYADGSGEVGVPDMDPEVYRQIVFRADELGMDVATHAIGDRGVRHTLDAYRDAKAANGGEWERRNRVEHVETIKPEDIPRFGREGVTASMQPFHAAPTTDPSQTPWTTLVGPVRERTAFPWRRLIETGAHMAFGSDWPVVTPDVRVGLQAALTRRSVKLEPEGGWQPQLCVTLAQALDAYTTGAARIERQETVKGMLRPGMLADITVFGQDLFKLAPHEILDVDIAMTMVDGRVVYRTV